MFEYTCAHGFKKKKIGVTSQLQVGTHFNGESKSKNIE